MGRHQLVDERRAALNSTARIRLIIGEPGVGKTFFGCQLAEHEIGTARILTKPYQKVLILTFARNAVARIRQILLHQATTNIESSATQDLVVRRRVLEDRIRIDTFSGFFWWLIDSFARYSDDGSALRPWFIGPYRIGGEHIPNGHIGFTFEETEEAALSVLRVDAVRLHISNVYPLVIVDEHQDIDERLHEIVSLLSEHSHLVLLHGPGQCIYGSMKKFDPKIVLRRTLEELQPEKLPIAALGGEQQRHCQEIANFVAQYDSSHACSYDGKKTKLKLVSRERVFRETNKMVPNELEANAAYVLKEIRSFLNKRTPKKRISLAVLASTNNGVADLHKRLAIGGYGLKPIRADLSLDDTVMLRYGRLVLSLLSAHWISADKSEPNTEILAIEMASLACNSKDEIASSSPSLWLPFAKKLIGVAARQKRPKANDDPVKKLREDLVKINDLLRATKKKLPEGTPSTPFNRGDIGLLDHLARYMMNIIEPSLWTSGSVDIAESRKAFESSMQQRIIFEKLGISENIEVMTIHKAKGREFDGVVLVFEDNRNALWRSDSRTQDSELLDLYRVAISRARYALRVVAYEDAIENAKPAVHRLLNTQH